MARRRSEKQEWVPWYRRADCKGDLTEVEKRELDAFRMRGKHPATHLADLPEEVQDYINALELQVYDFKQEKAVAKPLLAGVVGAFISFLSYKGIGYLGDLGYVFGVLLLTVPWFIYRREWRKNANEFIPNLWVVARLDNDAPGAALAASRRRRGRAARLPSAYLRSDPLAGRCVGSGTRLPLPWS